MPLGHIYRNISHDGGQWKMRLGSRQNQQEIEKNRLTPHQENDPKSALPKPKKPSDQNEKPKYAGSYAWFGLMFQLYIALQFFKMHIGWFFGSSLTNPTLSIIFWSLKYTHYCLQTQQYARQKVELFANRRNYQIFYKILIYQDSQSIDANQKPTKV